MNVRIIVPQPDDRCAWTKTHTTVEAYGPRIAAIAGGFTATQGTGGWVDGDGHLVVEPVTVFDIYLDHRRSPVVNPIARLRALCIVIARDLVQDYVYFGVGDDVEFVPG